MNDNWLGQVIEPIVDPEREIVDPHHHLWRRPDWVYELDELWSDTSAGHNVVQTIYMECRSSYFEEGPEHLRPVGETKYVQEIAAASAADSSKATIAAIVAHADLRLPELDETERLPCLATRPPPQATTKLEAVDTLNRLAPSPPVPTMSTMCSPLTSTCAAS